LIHRWASSVGGQLSGGTLWFEDLTAACVMTEPVHMPMGWAGLLLPLASFGLSWRNIHNAFSGPNTAAARPQGLDYLKVRQRFGRRGSCWACPRDHAP
jgi:hypothetical protein